MRQTAFDKNGRPAYVLFMFLCKRFPSWTFPQPLLLQKQSSPALSRGFLATGIGGNDAPAAIPSRLHRSIARVLLSAESAARRLIVVLARITKMKARRRAPCPCRTGAIRRRSAAADLPLFDPRQRFLRQQLGAKRPAPAAAHFPFSPTAKSAPSPGDNMRPMSRRRRKRPIPRNSCAGSMR